MHTHRVKIVFSPTPFISDGTYYEKPHIVYIWVNRVPPNPQTLKEDNPVSCLRRGQRKRESDFAHCCSVSNQLRSLTDLGAFAGRHFPPGDRAQQLPWWREENGSKYAL